MKLAIRRVRSFLRQYWFRITTLLVLFFVARLVSRSIVLYFQTGSMFIQPYEFYGPVATAERLYPSVVAGNLSARCTQPPPRLPTLDSLLLSVNALRGLNSSGSVPTNVVYVTALGDDGLLSFLWNTVLEDGTGLDVSVRVFAGKC